MLDKNTEYNDYYRTLIIIFIFLFLISRKVFISIIKGNFSSLGPMMNIYIPEIVSEVGF